MSSNSLDRSSHKNGGMAVGVSVKRAIVYEPDTAEGLARFVYKQSSEGEGDGWGKLSET